MSNCHISTFLILLIVNEFCYNCTIILMVEDEVLDLITVSGIVSQKCPLSTDNLFFTRVVNPYKVRYNGVCSGFVF